MGISTLQSYKGAQIFEALGLHDEVIRSALSVRPVVIQGVNFEVLAEESLRRHRLGYSEDASRRLPTLPNPGEFHWRAEGERHGWDPQAIADLQVAARAGTRTLIGDSPSTSTAATKMQYALRGLLEFKQDPSRPAVPIEEVERLRRSSNVFARAR